MVTMEQLKEAKDTLEMYNKELEKKHQVFLEAKKVFDEEAKNGDVKESTCNILILAMKSYENLMHICSLHRAYALSTVELYNYQQRVKGS